ncbi:hypothetical protein, partial [Sedimenticola sp.]|uniref:hypothetical protein n=1 Tax=Sedimenticola sp. TaxID=1940285 RepID=UPI003D0DEABE
FFEAKVATELSAIVSGYDAEKDRIFSLSVDGKIQGPMTVNGTSEKWRYCSLALVYGFRQVERVGAGNRQSESPPEM